MAPWEKYGGPPAAQTQQAPPPQAPGIILGRPKAPSPVEQERLRMEAERLDLARQDQARQNQQGDLTAQNTQLDIDKKARAAAVGPAADATEGERTAAFLATRVADSVKKLKQHEGSKPSGAVETVRSIFGDTAANYLTPDDRQVVEANQLDFLDSALTLGTGAAYTKEQLEGYRKTYFPQLGDGPATIAEKSRKLEVLLQAARTKAGTAAPLIDQALAELMGQEGAGEQGGPTVLPRAAGAKSDPNSPFDGVTPDGTGFSPVPELYGIGDKVAELIGRGASTEQVVGWLREQYAPYNLDVSTELQGMIGSIVQKHKANPRQPVKSLGTGWENLHMRPEGAGESTLVGEVADTPVGAAVIGAADTVTGGWMDEIGGLLGGDTEAIRAATEFSREERPVATFAGQVGGGLALPLGRAGSVASMAKGGAAYGGIYGAGSANGTVGDRLTGGAVGALIGGGAGAGVGKVTGALGSRSAAGSAAQAERNALLQDFQSEGVRVLPANVGGAGTNRMTAGMAQSPVGSGAIRSAAKEQAETFGTAVNNAAGRSGRVMPADEAGEAFRKSAQAGIERDGQRIGRIYEAAKREAQGVKIKPRQGIKQIDDEIAALNETGSINQPLIAELEKLKASLQQNSAMSIDGLKMARSFAGKAASNQELRATPAKATMARVFDALATDFEAGLRAAGRGRAATLFGRADKLWKARIDDIDGAWEPIIGAGKSGEDIVKSIETMAQGGKGGFVRLKTVLSGASSSERGDMIGTLIERMGKARNGAQDATGETFSPATFLTNWSGMSKKAKALMFGNSELRQSLDSLSRIAGSIKETGKYANSSNTGGAIAAQSLIGAGGFAAGDLTGLALTTGGTFLTGRLLASPRFAAWLAKAPRNPSPAQSRAYVERLRSIATAEPVIAADISKFAQFMNAANDVSPARAVAEGQQEDN